LNSEHGWQEGEIPPEQLTEREAHGGGKGDSEGERMALASIVGHGRLGGDANWHR